MVSQHCSRFAMIRVLWVLEDLTHKRPLIPTSSSQGTNCCRSDRISLWGASSLGGYTVYFSTQYDRDLLISTEGLTFWPIPERPWIVAPLLQIFPSHLLALNHQYMPARVPCLYWQQWSEQIPGHPPATGNTVGGVPQQVMSWLTGEQNQRFFLDLPEHWAGSSWWLPQRPGKTKMPAHFLLHPPWKCRLTWMSQCRWLRLLW